LPEHGQDIYQEAHAKSEFTFYRIENGTFTEDWNLTDMDALMRQIGQAHR
jgi:predicted ester cyclase